MRFEIHVQPGASTRTVGGEHDGALVVRVAERPEGGRATDAALRAVADALELPRRSVTLVRGGSSRRKVVNVETDHDDEVAAKVQHLRRGGRSPA